MKVDYIQDLVRKKLADEIKYLELPSEWKPDEVIRYIVRIIENGQAPR